MRSPADESSLAPTERFDAAAVAGALFAAAKKEVLAERSAPLSTYRLQFHRSFRFADAMVLAPYFERLGISHVYASPYFNAAPGSAHGYDVVDHNALNPEIGTWEEHEAFCAALHARALGQLLDFVPNHMGIERGNAMWNDVLENGAASMYAKYFDIDWDPVKEELKNKVLLPVLGDQYGIVLERGELKLAFAEGALVLRYFDRSFPIAPKQYATLLKHRIDALEKSLGDTHPHFVELQSILTAIDHLPRQSETELAKVIERNREKEVIKRRLATLAADSAEVSSFIARNVEIFNGTPGDPRSFDLLDSVLGSCSYRLAHWRVAGEEINYRRFFDINSLAAVRVEDPDVFDSIHALVFRWISEGKVSGLRIDHPDGLFDPTAYFLDLQERYWVEQTRRRFEKQRGEPKLWPKVEAEVRRLFRAEADQPDSPVARALYVIVEKIQGGRERVPDAWAIAGNTGYRFANVVGGLFVDKSAERAITDTYVRFVNRRYQYRELVYEKKKLIMSAAMASEINVLARELNRISEMNRRTRDFTLNALRRALVEFVAIFPVYRTYVDGWRPEVDQRDIQYIEWTIARAKERDPTTSVTIFDFLRDILLRRRPEALDQREREARLRFAMKVQQVTGPVMAKALEDTVFYIYNRLVSLNEVGGEPERFGTSQEAFHLRNQERVERWPGSLCATSTHDTKRSEDVRARISVISELPEEWRACLRRWARLNRRYKRAEGIPDGNDEYLFYQTVLGAWPMGDAISAEEFDLFRQRIEQYMLKAIKEAKVNTSWVNPNPDYESAVAEFTRAVLDPSGNPKFIADAREFKKRLEVPGQVNGLAQALLKIASPGVCDIYQGCEIWDLSLVDPDNRRPVDFALRQRLLEELDRSAEVDRLGLARRLAAEMTDGRAKLFLLSQGLRFKRLRSTLFRAGEYLPLAASGPHGNRVVCFCRRLRESLVIAIVPRLVTALIESGGIAASLRETFIQLPAELGAANLRDVFTGRSMRAEDRRGAVTISAGEALRDFPVALLEKAAND